MHHAYSKIGDFFSLKFSVGARAVAAGTGDNFETDGTGFDRYVNGVDGSAGIYNSATFILLAFATLTSAKKATYKATIQESDSLASNYTDIAAALQPGGAADSVVLTLSYVDGNEEGSYALDINLESLKRYIRAQVHHDLDAGASDLSTYCAGFIPGGISGGPIPVA